MIRKHAVKIYSTITCAAYLVVFAMMDLTFLSAGDVVLPAWPAFAALAVGLVFNLAWGQADHVVRARGTS